jgi:hypothetical protein
MFGAHWDAYGVGAADRADLRPGANDDALALRARACAALTGLTEQILVSPCGALYWPSPRPMQNPAHPSGCYTPFNLSTSSR